ncbi:hypothetical protein [Larkinella terrae]|uniref:Uncharacterized protein n=1 Tax=Larkinella terrae TaxID=2025311 RepID=A0A7K0ERL4_9BACT|nr:hypothetical protein [Larkinella terrae]MRS64437.1 hypothetical protein [Larkinella terrae]
MLEKLINHYSNYSVILAIEFVTLIPIIVGVIFIRHLNISMKFLLIYYIIVFIRDFISNVSAVYRINNHYLYNLSGFVEIITVGLIYYKAVDTIKSKKWIAILAGLSVFFGTFLWSSTEFSSGILTLADLCSMGISILYFNTLIAELKIINILKHSLFWVSSGLIVQAAGTFFIFLFAKTVFSENVEYSVFYFYWQVRQIMYIIFCVLSSIGFWVSKEDKYNYT